jgi:hypothetical protein
MCLQTCKRYKAAPLLGFRLSKAGGVALTVRPVCPLSQTRCPLALLSNLERHESGYLFISGSKALTASPTFSSAVPTRSLAGVLEPESAP